MSQPSSIAIIGGGLGGLTLASILHRHDIPTTVFETDAYPLVRPQGGSLDMHEDTGLHALRLAGLYAQFESVARPEDQGNRLYSPDGALMFADPGLDGDRPEIDRSQLRQLLIDSLPTSVIRWGEKVERVDALGQYGHAVVTAAGGNEAFDLVVGADGAWSQVRPLVSSAVPSYEGVTIFELGIDDVDRRYPEIAAMVGHGKMFAKGSGKTLAAQRNGNAHIRIYAALRLQEGALAVDLNDQEQAKRQLAAMFGGFAAELIALITKARFLAVRPMYAMPIGHRWTNRPDMTLIGDAAHLMSPFGGEGANGAMADGADLAMALIEGPDWHLATAQYEQIMFERAQEAAQGAAQGLESAVALAGLTHTLEHFERNRKAKSGAQSVITPLELFATSLASKAKNPELQKKINAAYRFDLTGPNGGSWIVDFKSASAGVRQSDEHGKCTVIMADDDFVDMLAGRIDPQKAFMAGKIRIKGDMGMALKLSSVLAA